MMTSVFSSAVLNHSPHSPHRSSDAPERVLDRASFAKARAAIEQWPAYAPTPLHNLSALAQHCGIGAILYKDEGLRFGLGSFKALGGAYAAQQLSRRELSSRLGRAVSLAEVLEGRYRADAADIHIVTATDGNHGRSVAWGCTQFGATCHIYIHAEVSEGRAQSMAALGAEVTRVDGNYDASVRAAQRAADDNGWYVVSDTSYEGYTQVPSEVMAGYGVLAAEVVQQIGDQLPTHVFLQGGVGGLAAAISARLIQAYGERAPRVVVVEPDDAACLLRSAQRGTLSEVHITRETLMAGLSCGEPSLLAWQILQACASDFISMPDSLVAPAMWRMAHPLGQDPAIVAGESAIPGIACLLAAAVQPELAAAIGLEQRSRALIIGSEGATDEQIYRQLIAVGAH